MASTLIRSSAGPGLGVGRWVTWNGEPFDGRMAARCWLGAAVEAMAMGVGEENESESKG